MRYTYGQEKEAARRFMRRLRANGMCELQARIVTHTAMHAFAAFMRRGDASRANERLSNEMADWLSGAGR